MKTAAKAAGINTVTLYRLLKQKLPDTTLVSIGHRASLGQFHRIKLALRGSTLVPA